MKPVLIVEDEAIMRESLRDWLKDAGYEVETAEEGEEALQRIGEVDFGIVILDLRLPGKDGLEVLKEAKTQRPQLKGIIITAYPSVETAVEAMKIGAVDYLPKPFAPEAVEKLVQETLGPVQVEIKPKTTVEEAIEAVVEAPAVEEAKVEEVVTITPEEAPAHLERGKELFKAKDYTQALKEFEAVKEAAPASIEARTWIQKGKAEIAAPAVAVEEGVEEGGKPKECLWMKMGMVSHRLCTNNYNCLTCEFDQEMQERMASGEESPEIAEAMERLKALPGNRRLCRYALKGDVCYRLCTRLFTCSICEFAQIMQDELERKQAKLAVRREALRKKEQKAEG